MLNNFVGPVSILDYEHIHHIVVFQTRTLFWGYMSLLAGPTLELFGSAPPPIVPAQDIHGSWRGSPWAPVRFSDCSLQSVEDRYLFFQRHTSTHLLSFPVVAKIEADHFSFSAFDKTSLSSKDFWRSWTHVTQTNLLESQRNTGISRIWFFWPRPQGKPD